MVRVSLHVVSLWLLLLLTGTRGGPARCMNEKQAVRQWSRYLRQIRDDGRMEGARTCHQSQQNSGGTCDQAIKAMIKDPPTQEKNRRSVSPWEYLLDQNEDRFPPVINVARCLCEGCIIHGREDRSYNSVPVCANMMVVRKKACPHDPNRYMVQKKLISVPVACVCLRPKY